MKKTEENASYPPGFWGRWAVHLDEVFKEEPRLTGYQAYRKALKLAAEDFPQMQFDFDEVLFQRREVWQEH